jgi:membrane associated rhomboid family serine protease
MADIATRTPPAAPQRRAAAPRRGQSQLEGLRLLGAIVAVMWVVEVVNSLDSNKLDNDGIYSRSVSHLWGILTAPFLHASFAHLISNTIPFVFMGAIIALRGAVRLALVTAIVILIAGFGTWLIGPAGVPTIGASGVVFGYATYLFARGFFDRSVLELFTGLIVGVIWGAALLASIVPQPHVSWEGHVCGAIGGVVAAFLLRRDRPGPRSAAVGGRSGNALAK